MSYRNQLHPWCVVRFLPDAQTLVVSRFRRCGEAEAYLKIIRRLTPSAVYEVVFCLDEQNFTSLQGFGLMQQHFWNITVAVKC
ncbi:hypothetical protein C7B65_14720 [Phormidesmis priestleyi ULC007]|uniref:Uncharacterized protein n=1 Tax=Phormidesmis priestleyi ULC007 TaxID=1920490 RepID=A0A2T1DDI5_9CYAN|nr:hypothetical protein C7B65_14720 [Phormidesmis priestleyi ULC007]PZO49802.1 MAG: hypothetical protein DCF14_13360 [Phormidesmis priestleyi]